MRKTGAQPYRENRPWSFAVCVVLGSKVCRGIQFGWGGVCEGPRGKERRGPSALRPHPRHFLNVVVVVVVLRWDLSKLLPLLPVPLLW